MVEPSAASQLTLEAQESAIDEISKLLQHPEDLTRLTALRADYLLKEKTNNAQLTALLQTHIESIQNALELLERAQKSVLKLRACFEQIDTLCRECASLIENHEKIQMLSITHRNIVQTLEEIDDIIDLPSNAIVAENMLEDDSMLLEVAKTLTILQGTSSIVQGALRGNRGHNEEMKNLQEYFDKVKSSMKKFEEKIWRLFSDYRSLGKDNPGLLVACLQVVEIQEAMDAEAVTEPKRYKEKALSTMEEAVKTRFLSLVDQCQNLKLPDEHEEDYEQTDIISKEILENATDLADDLTEAYDFVSPCFPPKYRIFQMIFNWYHKEFSNVLYILSKKVECFSNQEILDIIGWTESYYETLRGLGIEEEELKFEYDFKEETENNSESENEKKHVLSVLYDVYVERNRKSTSKWYLNILEVDVSGEPKVDNDGKLWTPSFVDFFRILNDGISTIETITKGEMLFRAADSSLEMMQDFIKSEKSIIERSLPFEMLCAIANNNQRSYDLAIEFIEHFEDIALEEFKQKLDVDSVSRGFLDTAKMAMIKLTDDIYSDPGMVDLLKKLYQTKDWKDGVVMTTFLATLEDYFQDLKEFLDGGVYKRVVESSLKKAMEVFIEALISKMPAITEDVVSRLLSDEQEMRNFFTPYSTADRVEQQLQSLSNLRSLVCSDSTEAFVLSYHSILDLKPDIPPVVVEKICGARKDISRQDASEIVEQCKELYIQRQKMMNKGNVSKEQLDGDNTGQYQVTNIWNRIWNKFQDE